MLDERTIRTSIQNRIRDQGTTARAVSLAAGLGPDALQKYLSGRTRSLSAIHMHAVCHALNFSNMMDRLDPSPAVPAAAQQVRFFGVNITGVRKNRVVLEFDSCGNSAFHLLELSLADCMKLVEGCAKAGAYMACLFDTTETEKPIVYGAWRKARR
jgi:hypothetical protein